MVFVRLNVLGDRVSNQIALMVTRFSWLIQLKMPMGCYSDRDSTELTYHRRNEHSNTSDKSGHNGPRNKHNYRRYTCVHQSIHQKVKTNVGFGVAVTDNLCLKMLRVPEFMLIRSSPFSFGISALPKDFRWNRGKKKKLVRWLQARNGVSQQQRKHQECIRRREVKGVLV